MRGNLFHGFQLDIPLWCHTLGQKTRSLSHCKSLHPLIMDQREKAPFCERIQYPTFFLIDLFPCTLSFFSFFWCPTVGCIGTSGSLRLGLYGGAPVDGHHLASEWGLYLKRLSQFFSPHLSFSDFPQQNSALCIVLRPQPRAGWCRSFHSEFSFHREVFLWWVRSNPESGVCHRWWSLSCCPVLFPIFPIADCFSSPFPLGTYFLWIRKENKSAGPHCAGGAILWCHEVNSHCSMTSGLSHTCFC